MAKFKQILCRECQQITKHNILSHTTREIIIDEIGEGVSWDYYALQCRGCEHVCIMSEKIYSEDRDLKTGEYAVSVEIHPTPHKDDREPIQDIEYVPDEVIIGYSETVSAFNYGMPILCAIGIRTIVEAICKDKNIAGANLKQQIDKMAKERLITPDGSDLLHLIRDTGNFSAHEMKKHDMKKLQVCLDIVESLMKDLYIFPALKKSIIL